MRAGDVVRAVNGIPFASYDVAPRSQRVGPGEVAELTIARRGRVLAISVPFVPLSHVALAELISSAAVSLAFWAPARCSSGGDRIGRRYASFSVLPRRWRSAC